MAHGNCAPSDSGDQIVVPRFECKKLPVEAFERLVVGGDDDFAPMAAKVTGRSSRTAARPPGPGRLGTSHRRDGRGERTEACTMLGSLPGNWSYYCDEGNPANLSATIADANDALMIIIGSSRGGLVSVLERAWGSRCLRS
ncbi:hypothetical protein WSS_A30189 [Rhodococcus opacus M213]|uniref:Uncharacterized protein n=1 Tax=Rhodococcus opacus M213 TaxID=1129896 RepID=K8XKQ0_RHOOP|nr:hypothetical protein WSS_A30189 [Rhodococcus opacus M213]